MPDLPTITVTSAQAQRILDAYQARFGTTTVAETESAYRRELAQHVRDVVITHESRVIDEENNAAKRDALEAVAAELPDPDSV